VIQAIYPIHLTCSPKIMATCKQSVLAALFVLTQHIMFKSCGAFTFEVYPEHQTLISRVISSGLYQQLSTPPADMSWSPTALWNSTANSKTAACHQYLRDNGLDQPSAGSCAATYICNVTENLHRFPAVLIYAECSGSSCVDSYHTGLGTRVGSRGNCQPKSHHRVTFLVFKPQPTVALSGDEVANTQLNGEWIWHRDEYLPLNCQCRAK
jgi:hypothetical protein